MPIIQIRRIRKAQSAGSAGAFIALIAGFLLLYILLVPADLREELLTSESSTTTGSTTAANTDTVKSLGLEEPVLEEQPGRIDYLKFNQYDHPLPAVNLYTTTSAKEKNIGDSVYVKKGVFDKEEKNISFELSDPSLIENVYLSFALNPNRNNKGRLLIWLNGNLIFEREYSLTMNSPIVLSKKYLEKKNTLKFEVSGVGWRFWTTNDYELDNIRVIYDQTDISAQTSKNTIMLTESEKFNLEGVKLKFNPDCTPREVGILNVKVNNNIVFSAIPDCGQLNIVEMSPSVLEMGNNFVVFETEKGYYLIDQINLQTSMKTMTYPVHYFDLDERLFSIYQEEDEDEGCGDVDGICPVDCPEYLDKDCCLEKSSRYWCDVMPNNENNRCRAVVYESDCYSCPSGYEDSSGNPPEVCEDKCGDDTDNECPAGCNKLYDKDCCMEEASTNYWCNDVPQYGLSHVCKAAIHLEDCENCPSGYETEDGTFSCPAKVVDSDEETVLRPKYHVWLRLKFLDDGERKAAKVFVNGYQFYIDTTRDTFERKIDNYVEDGSNAIKIEPDRTTLDIIKMEIAVEDA
ncbi:hypothetical protein JXB31_00015 [Candidatus Woesearchaeota archaeon]|nr:hypothetical protein [Candidatus Woesearchaeota archaeon]